MEQDEHGYVKRIRLNIHILTPNYSCATFQPVWTEEGNKKLQTLIQEGKLAEGSKIQQLEVIFDSEGNPLITIAELTRKGLAQEVEEVATASFWTPGGYISVINNLIGIHGITYRIPFSRLTKEVVLTIEGEAKLVVRDEAGNIDQLITDQDLKRVEFTETGEVKLRSKS